MKVAYWPGCVSRGFTPELHGSMELVAPQVGLELAELDRANCCGAGVIAEHNQELADTLNARTFAMAQATDGAVARIPTSVPKPQSVPAITFSRPTILASRTMRSATSSGCSTKLVVVSISPGMRSIDVGSGYCLNSLNSCACRGFAISSESAPTFA